MMPPFDVIISVHHIHIDFCRGVIEFPQYIQYFLFISCEFIIWHISFFQLLSFFRRTCILLFSVIGTIPLTLYPLVSFLIALEIFLFKSISSLPHLLCLFYSKLRIFDTLFKKGKRSGIFFIFRI